MNQTEQKLEYFSYDDEIVKKFTIATMTWAGVAFLLGIVAALQLASYKFNLGPWFSFGRLRPLHTNAAIFAFAGNAVFAGVYYSTQRLCKARMFSDFLSKIHFWGWQLIILSAAITLPLGMTVGKEYAELELPIKILIALIWVVFGVNFFGTLFKRREKHLYVALWFYIATIITVAVLHIINSINIPVSFFKSYPIYAGVQDALVQWWYGHNAVAFFLTTPFLGMMYYFVPKAAGRPVYSYKLSIVHFWSLVFMYIWAGPHHLLYTAVPEWAQTVGMVFSLMIWAPSWGGMINGLLTLRGVWDRVRKEPILKFFAAGITFYGMATFEGPLLSIKSVNAVAHYTDWIIGHVHGGALGWNGFMTFGMLYWLVPKLWKTELHSQKLANTHFWFGTIGILIYIISMWVAGITQGMMLLAVDSAGKLAYPDFIQTTLRIMPMYWLRAAGGTLFLAGFILMIYNIVMTVKSAKKTEPEIISAPALGGYTPLELVDSVAVKEKGSFHRALEGLAGVMTIMALISILVGSVIELLPAMMSSEWAPANPKIKPYTPLELAGRDIYVREGCYLCHSQQIRPLEGEVTRYGAYSKLEESQWDHPFQWGSKRTGPDLARVGGKYPDLWHFRHMLDPREVSPGSVMPSYSWMFEDKIDFRVLTRKLEVMKFLGVPYSDLEIAQAGESARIQAKAIADGLETQGIPKGMENKEIMAVISYLQRLGSDAAKASKNSVAGE